MSAVEPEPFDAFADCSEDHGCPLVEECTLRCHERYLDDQVQANDWLADQEQAESWRRFYATNPGAEEALKAACDPKTYEETA